MVDERLTRGGQVTETCWWQTPLRVCQATEQLRVSTNDNNEGVDGALHPPCIAYCLQAASPYSG